MNEKMIQSTRTAFDIIETIAERDRPSITTIADAVGCSRSTVHYHLKTLQQNNYVIRNEEGLRLGLRMARLGNLALRSHHLTGIIEKTTDNLAMEADTVAYVTVMEGNKLVCLYRSSNQKRDGLQMDIGKEIGLHCTAAGQAILAHLSHNTVETIVHDSELPAATEHTLTNRDELQERLKTIRQIGIAYSSQEYQVGFSSIAAPIFEKPSEVVGAIGIIDSHSRVGNPYNNPKARRFSDELPDHVQRAARITGDHVSDP